MSTFAEWKKRSKLFKSVRIRNNPNDIDESCQAAYKAGERQGREDAEEIARRAIELRKMLSN